MPSEKTESIEEQQKKAVQQILRVFQEILYALNGMKDHLQYHFKEPLTLELLGGIPPTKFIIRRWSPDTKARDRRERQSERFDVQEARKHLGLKPKGREVSHPYPYDSGDLEDYKDYVFFGLGEEVVGITPLDFIFSEGHTIQVLMYDQRMDVQRVIRRFGNQLARAFGAKAEFRNEKSLKEIMTRNEEKDISTDE